MPLRKDIPASAVGWFAVIVPRIFWNAAFLYDGYETVARRTISGLSDEYRDDANRLFQSYGDILIQSFTTGVDPKFRRLPLEDPKKQQVYRKIRVAGSVVAYVTELRFFTFLSVYEIIKFDAVTANSIQEAQKLVMARPDVQQIERHHVELR